MNENLSGRIICGVGGLYTVLCSDGKTVKCKARGILRKKKITPLAGDLVTVRRGDGEEKGLFIDTVSERKTELSRPPVANIDTVFVLLCPSDPEPNLLATDKLLVAISSAGITPVVVISKSDTAPEKAAALFDIYSKCYVTFLSSAEKNEGISELFEFISEKTTVCAFAGASGVGKSTLLGTLFRELSLKTGKISEKTHRGKHTTREVTLFLSAKDISLQILPAFHVSTSTARNIFRKTSSFSAFLNLKSISENASTRVALIFARKGVPSLKRFASARFPNPATKITLRSIMN